MLRKALCCVAILTISGVVAVGMGGLLVSLVDFINKWPNDDTVRWTMDDLPELLPGDIVIERHSMISSRLLQLGLHSYWNHITVIVNSDYYIVENTGNGVVLENLENDTNLAIAVYRYPDLSEEERDRIAWEAMTLVGKENDWQIVLRSVREAGWQTPIILTKALWALWTDDGDVPLPHIVDDYLVCSEVVQEAYSQAGFPLVADEYLLLPKNVAIMGRDGELERLFGPDKI